MKLQHHNPEDHVFNLYCHENFKSLMKAVLVPHIDLLLLHPSIPQMSKDEITKTLPKEHFRLLPFQ
jgi:hypothetical protein